MFSELPSMSLRRVMLWAVMALTLAACDFSSASTTLTEAEQQSTSGQVSSARSAEEDQSNGHREATTSDRSSATGVVKTIDAAKRVTLPGGEVGEGEKRHVEIPARDSYWLDYTVRFEPGFFYTKTGKLPGLAGGNATTGCDRIDPAGWSARLGWTLDGKGKLYVYDQHRDDKCGTNHYFTDDRRYEAGETHRLTQWIKLNTPGQRDGVIRVWLDGMLAVTADNLELRGNVSGQRARIDTLAYSVFSGGKDPSVFAPPHDQSISFGPIKIATCRPDFDVAATRCDAS